ncbi:MAG: hypothetical protein HZA53_08195 [Planctomycetes bacterium]|nr:hypothetical protein [Planctomycetota bacterium]
MSRAQRSSTSTFLLLILAACSSGGERREAERERELLRPRPTENVLDDEDEERQHELRREWYERLHRAARGVDWRAIEDANAEAELQRRNALAATQAQWLVGPTRWTEVGSRNQAGRTHCGALGVDAGGNAALYVGTDKGGIWRGTLSGTSWTALGDNVFGGVHELAVLPGEFAGEPDFLLVATSGGLVHVSRDGGGTWTIPAGLPTFTGIRAVRKLANASKTILILGSYNSLGTKSSVWGSNDYGRTFTQRWIGPGSWGGGLWVPRAGASAATNAYLLDRGQLFTSTNGGASFATGAVIDATATKGVLCGSEAGAPTLYAALQIGGVWKLYRSTNGGTNFAYVIDITNSFYETLTASIVNANLVMYGGLEVWRSTNAGASFARINTWSTYYGDPLHKLHADSFGIDVAPDPAGAPGAENWYIATDGGTYVSTNGGVNVLNLCGTGIGIGQYYSTLTSRTTPALCLAGAQDQGYQRGSVQPPSPSGPSTDFTQLISGDYGHLTSGDGSHAFVYCTYPGFVLVQVGEASPSLVAQLNFPTGSTNAWMPPVVADPLDNTRFFFLGHRLWRYTRTGTSTWANAQWSTQDFTVGGGAWMSALDFAPTNPQRAYAVNDVGRLFWSTDHGVTWTLSSSVGGGAQYFYGQDVEAHPENPLIAVVGGSGYSTAGVRRTLDGGVTWSALTAGLPQTLVYDLAWATDGSEDVYAATESGPYRWDAQHSTWLAISENRTPITTYWSVEIVDQGRTARFGTYGRGIWDYALPEPPPRYLRPERY